MTELRNRFIGSAFLRSVWALDYEAFKDSDEEKQLHKTLQNWAERTDLKETSAEGAFVDAFFKDIWGYTLSGGGNKEFNLYPRYPVKGAGAKGGTGEADLAIGWFNREGVPDTPQVLCEFKDIKTSLDAPQKSRKDNTRSPVKQALDYLKETRRGLFGNEPVLPTWAIVTDMNEFRLYWYDRAPQQFLQFVISPSDLFQGRGLRANDEQTRWERFLFRTLFHKETLLTTGGRSKLAQLIAQQWVKEGKLEDQFYKDYRAFREKLYNALLRANPTFPGTNGKLVRLAQKILDRCIFIFFCEDMGQALSFPPQILRDFLIYQSGDQYFVPTDDSIWARLKTLFRAMNEGNAFADKQINQFNGGLFDDDPELEALTIPNSVFCHSGQGQNEASLHQHKDTLLYLCAAYNYAAESAQGLMAQPADGAIDADQRDPSKSLSLYTLGRIFEQSITELEILEAEVDGFLSINKESKRKTDGVYYTPEWVVERIVAETLGPRLSNLKAECGWPKRGFPNEKAIEAYRDRLQTFTVVDPACGSGAFLITALRYLIEEWHTLQDIRSQVTGGMARRDDAELIRDILKSNIYGVDINPASVEIAQLALWLHTARGDKPLSSLNDTIKCGNSLIGPEFYKGQIDLNFYNDVQMERVNAFDWETAFPEVFERGGFDAVISNPPYVKLQNFRRVHPDMADFLRAGRDGVATVNGYKSAKTGNFDLYLPFIEKGLALLNKAGRLGYIAPSLWTVNEYGEGLRGLIAAGRNLDGWIDFGAFQIFDEATIYTALQFYSREPADAVKLALARDGVVPESPWDNGERKLKYAKVEFGNRWLLIPGSERDLLDRIYSRSSKLGDAKNSRRIYQGLITSADSVYHLKRLANGRYLCTPKGAHAPPPYEVEIEDVLMKPLVSGADAKRYVEPAPETYLLFPYAQDDDGRMALIDQATMQAKYPKAWKYLQSYEGVLRKREATLEKDGSFKSDAKGRPKKAPFNDDAWYRFGRHQNLDKQEIEKLIVPRLVANLFCSVDHGGNMYLDNVDVGGVSVSEDQNIWFIAGILNAKVAGFVFRRVSKPFRGEYRSANKQFIAPLPIPKATKEVRAMIAARAQRLQQGHTNRRNFLVAVSRRMQTMRYRSKPENFLFPDLLSIKEWEKQAPATLDADERKLWAKGRYDEDLQGRFDEIGARLHEVAGLDAEFENGELSFSIDGVKVLHSIFLEDDAGTFILAQWKVVAQTFSITDKTDGRKLCNALRKIGATDNDATRVQIISLQKEMEALEAEIEVQEREMNSLVYSLYKLSDDDIAVIEAG